MIESTAVWHWFFTEDAVKKDKILEQFAWIRDMID